MTTYENNDEIKEFINVILKMDLEMDVREILNKKLENRYITDTDIKNICYMYIGYNDCYKTDIKQNKIVYNCDIVLETFLRMTHNEELTFHNFPTILVRLLNDLIIPTTYSLDQIKIHANNISKLCDEKVFDDDEEIKEKLNNIRKHMEIINNDLSEIILY